MDAEKIVKKLQKSKEVSILKRRFRIVGLKDIDLVRQESEETKLTGR